MSSAAVPVPTAGPMVNAHTHLYSALAAFGLPAEPRPPRDFLEILKWRWWRLDRALDLELLRAGARHYVAEALLAGTTTLVDHHESPECIAGSLDVLADVCQEMGMRAVLCYGATERNRGPAEAEAGLAECARFIRANRRPLVRGMVGLHASFTVGDDTLVAAGRLARELGVPVHVHMAEDRADVDDAIARGYEDPFERMMDLDTLTAGSVLAHGVWLSPARVVEAGQCMLWLVHNPRSNRGNRVGWAGALGAQRHVALGTDGYPSDLRAEGDALVALAHEQGDAAIDVHTPAVRLAAGAGLVSERFGPGTTVADAAVFDDDGTLREVVIDGRALVRDGRLLGADLDEIRARAREAAAELARRIEGLR